MQLVENWSLHRRCLLRSCTAILTALFIPARAFSETLGLGDEGYEHPELHETYQKFFQGKCPCSVGECRPTKVRPNAAVADTGMEVLIDRQWYPVPKDALQLRTDMPAELLEYPAHVCARRTYVQGVLQPAIECVVFNGAT
jgi:hypothetical protein